jgi:hypothetical protein
MAAKLPRVIVAVANNGNHCVHGSSVELKKLGIKRETPKLDLWPFEATDK